MTALAPSPQASTSRYTLPDLPYDFAALEPHYSGELAELHHGNHHAACVSGARQVIEQLDDARARDDLTTINWLEKNLAFNLSGHLLHSLFWANMSPDGAGRPDGELASAITFGSFDRLRAQLEAATVQVQGSGWGALSWDGLGQHLIIEQIYDHQGNVGHGSVPLLMIDVWEHPCYLQCRNHRGDFVDAFWHLVNLPDVTDRFRRSRSLSIL